MKVGKISHVFHSSRLWIQHKRQYPKACHRFFAAILGVCHCLGSVRRYLEHLFHLLVLHCRDYPNSQLTSIKALRNTCAGITEFDIFKLPVRILAMRDDEGDGEQLELVFGTVDEKSVEHRIIKPERLKGYTEPYHQGSHARRCREKSPGGGEIEKWTEIMNIISLPGREMKERKSNGLRLWNFGQLIRRCELPAPLDILF